MCLLYTDTSAHGCTLWALVFRLKRVAAFYRSNHFWMPYHIAQDTTPAKTDSKRLSTVIYRPPLCRQFGSGNEESIACLEYLSHSGAAEKISKRVLTTYARSRIINFVSHADVVSRHADVAQLVEQLIRNEQVVGSSPIISSI